jgi:glycosyltransferase involved in cell wall biosynthesis
MNPLISVVVPTLNRPHLLRQALLSIAGQSMSPGAVEAVVVNDGGSDITEPADAARHRGLPVRVVNLARRQGLPSARNIGIDLARGEYLAFLDDDDVFLPAHLGTALDALRGDADAAYTRCHVHTQRVNPTDPPPLPDTPSYPFDPDLLAVANFIPVHSVLLRRPPAGARFDPTLAALEDWDMWLRLTVEHGFRFVHVPQTTVVYHRIPEQESMCGSTVDDGTALAGFGRLTEQMWRRWPANNPKVARFRLYMGVMYWHALAELAQRHKVSDLYFQRCLVALSAVWHGRLDEGELVQKIIASVKGD